MDLPVSGIFDSLQPAPKGWWQRLSGLRGNQDVSRVVAAARAVAIRPQDRDPVRPTDYKNDNRLNLYGIVVGAHQGAAIIIRRAVTLIIDAGLNRKRMGSYPLSM